MKENIVPKKSHLASNGGGINGRSVCRYSSRPSRRVSAVSLPEFLALPVEAQCSECAAIAARRMVENTNPAPTSAGA